MRLSANLALESTLLDAGDGSRWVIMTGFGDANPKVLPPGFGNDVKTMISGDQICVGPGFKVDTQAYEGEWYSLEVFLPKIAENVEVDSEAWNFMELFPSKNVANEEKKVSGDSRHLEALLTINDAKNKYKVLNFSRLLLRIRDAKDKNEVSNFLQVLSRIKGAKDGEIDSGVLQFWESMTRVDESGKKGDSRAEKAQ